MSNLLSLQLDGSQELIWELVGQSLTQCVEPLQQQQSNPPDTPSTLVCPQEATEQRDWVLELQGWDPREPTVLQASEFQNY